MTAADVVVIELHEAPQGKGRPRFRTVTTKGGATFATAYTPSNTRQYEASLRRQAMQTMQGRLPLEGPLDVSVFAAMPIPESWSRRKRLAAVSGELRPTTKPDADNILKTLDSLNEVAFQDDKQIVTATIVKFYSERPFLRIEVRPAAPVITACLFDDRERVAI